MAVLRTANPALGSSTFDQPQAAFGDTMTVSGTVNKAGILVILAVATSALSWRIFSTAPENILPLLAIGGIGGFIVALLTVFKKTWAPATAPLYALLEGLVLGSASAMLEVRFPGIAMQAVGLTLGTLIALLLAYRSGLIRATENFKLGVVAATGGIALFYLLQFVLGFFGIQFHTVNSSGTIGIVFSLFVVAIAALNLVLDFDLIENGARMNAPRYMEWYGAFALMITLIWLYFEMLRLLTKLRSRD
jgi:uncharacterized YccA/Bax inhibitor family protein